MMTISNFRAVPSKARIDMTIYIAEVGSDFGPADRTAVFSSEENAWSWVRQQRADNPEYRWSWVQPYKVDDPTWEGQGL
jgi:hypothetical protein